MMNTALNYTDHVKITDKTKIKTVNIMKLWDQIVRLMLQTW